MNTHALSFPETDHLCEHDSLSFLSQRLIVYNCVCESERVCPTTHLMKPASLRHSILEVSFSLTPLDESQTQYFIYSVSLPPCLLVTLPLSNTYSNSSQYFKALFSESLNLSMERERHLVSFWKTKRLYTVLFHEC